MGKMRFKLSHVMPHAWFYKLREVGKPGTSQFKASDATRKSVFTSPVNRKAIDIPFPAETPKRSPRIQAPSEDFNVLDQLHLLELSDECRPSIVLPYAPAPENIMSLSLEGDNSHRISSAPDANACPPPCALNFDVRELERRLKALDLEDRRKYHSSPMLLSVSVPSPMLNGVSHISIKGPHGYKDLDGYSLDACGARECISNVCITDELSVDICGANGRGRKSPLLNVSYADAERPSEGCVGNGEGLCGSTIESNLHSTSSSDTGLERGSSSMWERDVFSITSDGSEAFTTTCPDEVEPAQKSRQLFWKLRERMSPSLYGNAHMDSGMSTFYEDNQEVGLGENDMVSGFFKSTTRHVAGDVQDGRRRVSHAVYKDSHMGEGLHEKGGGRASYVGNGATVIGDVGKRGGQYRIERSFSPRESHQEADGTSFSIRRHEVAMCRSMQSLLDYDEQADSFSLPDDRNDSLPVQDDNSDDRSRISAGRFSYARCKERILSSRMLVEQPRLNAGNGIEEEDSTLSNYAKFKLKQRGVLDSKVSASNVGMFLDPGLFNSVSMRGKHRCAHDNINSTAGINLSTDASIKTDQGSEYILSRRQSTSSYHSKSPHVQLGEGMSSKSNMQEQAPSGFKGTRRAVREKTNDPSFEQFSPSTSAGGTPSTTSRSGVFDSFAMVKCSYDPRHDFKESMVEMIMEKRLHSSHDMVELLQCYLTLNADVYHDTIVKVFTEVWSEMFQHR